jgi:hypothetical protein
MKTITFIRSYSGIDFTCACRFECNDKDHSGTYVLAPEANERIKVLEDALSAYVSNDDCKYGGSYKDFPTISCGDKSCRFHNGREALEVKHG